MLFGKIIPFTLIVLPAVAIAQDTTWKKIRVSEHLTASFPRDIDSIINIKQGKYTFTYYSGKVGSTLYTIQFSSEKSGFDIYDSVSYNEALKGIGQGILDRYKETYENPLIKDTTVQNIRMKAVSIEGLAMGTRMKSNYYIFIYNDRPYFISVIQSADAVSDSTNISHFLSSLQFNGEPQEKMYATPAESVPYKLGRVIGSLIFLVIIGVVVYVVIKAVQ